VRNLETSQRFLSPRLSSEQAQTQEGSHSTNATPMLAPGAVQFEILSGYNPLPAKPASAAKGAEGDSPKAGGAKKATAPKKVLPKGGVVKAPAQKGAPR
jgi:type IV pilus assembly protein PilN